MLKVNDKITIEARCLSIRFVRSRGPGGQNVNKVNTRAQLTFNMRECPTISAAVKTRLARLAGRRLTQQGTIILESDRFREQNRNRKETLERLRRLILKALAPPKPRRPTKPTAAAKRKRLADKKHRAKIKSQRGRVSGDE